MTLNRRDSLKNMIAVVIINCVRPSYLRFMLLFIVLLRGGGGGGGGGVHPEFFVKLDFEIAVDQQTRARDQTFEGVPNGACRTATPILGL